MQPWRSRAVHSCEFDWVVGCKRVAGSPIVHDDEARMQKLGGMVGFRRFFSEHSSS